MERWNQTARWSAARHDTRTKRWRPRPQLPGVLDLALGPMVGPLPMDGWACVPRPLPPLKKTGFHCPWWSSTITRTSRAAAASLPPPRPVPSRPVSPTRSPIPCSSCPVCRFDLSIEKKQNKNEKTLLEGPRDRYIDQHSRRCGARGRGGTAEERAAMAWSKLNPCALVSHVLFKVRLPSAPATRIRSSGAPSPPRSPSASPPALPGDRLDPRALILCLYADGRNRTINRCCWCCCCAADGCLAHVPVLRVLLRQLCGELRGPVPLPGVRLLDGERLEPSTSFPFPFPPVEAI